MRKTHSLSFKRKVILRVLEIGDTNKVARENQINTGTIYRWMKAYRQGKYKAELPN